MLSHVCETACYGLIAFERTTIDDEVLTHPTVRSALAIWYHLGARLAPKVDNIKLVPQIPIHIRWVKLIFVTWWAAKVLFEPLLHADFVKYLLAVIALHVFFLYNLEANRAHERIDELLIVFHDILLDELVVAGERENKLLGGLFDFYNKVSCLFLLILLQPCKCFEGALVVHIRVACRRIDWLHHL